MVRFLNKELRSMRLVLLRTNPEYKEQIQIAKNNYEMHRNILKWCSKLLFVRNTTIIVWNVVGHIHDRTYEAVMTTTCKPELNQEIMGRLHIPECTTIFRASYFGAYVKMSTSVEYLLLLCHYLMCKEATTYHRELLFQLHNYLVYFDRRSFYFFYRFMVRGAFPEYFIFKTVQTTCISICLGFIVSEKFTSSIIKCKHCASLAVVYVRAGILWQIPSNLVQDEYLALISDFGRIEEHLNLSQPRLDNRPTHKMYGFFYIMETFPTVG
uniref:Uncharacterized protein n=1 Tax=Lactuca sativa TaxID=4236 RepID=A0A9R1VMB8_LACSA|nr:hypothetical protein LSAT_V11C500266900 [Lactuca sativa]